MPPGTAPTDPGANPAAPPLASSCQAAVQERPDSQFVAWAAHDL